MNDFYKMSVVKAKESCTDAYIAALKEWLLLNSSQYFNDPNNKACSFADFEQFNKTVDREHLCLPNEVMLIDKRWGGELCYCICTISANNRVKTHFKVVAVADIRGDWRNGYFLLPSLHV